MTHPVIAAGTQAARIFFTQLDANGGFGDRERLGNGIHSNEFDTPDLLANHPGNGVAAGPAAPDDFYFCSALDVNRFRHLLLLSF
jgi:hypothetical protein